MREASGLDAWCRLADGVSLKRLESPYLYNRKSDELFELDEEGLAALARCDGGATGLAAGLEKDFFDFCVAEGLVETLSSPAPNPSPVTVAGPSPLPSLRYLEVQITRRCDLSCAHCYLGDAAPIDMEFEMFARVVTEFERMGGLRLMVSGGEPALHPEWARINGFLAGVGLRRVLLTNGASVLRGGAEALNFDDVQVSLDGMKSGHEALRGPGSHRRALAAARAVAQAGIDLSIATQAHAENLPEFDALEALVGELGAREWGIDAPCLSGRLTSDSPFAITPEEAARAMGHAFGGSYHGGSGGMACGLHLATVAPDGAVAQCGFYLDKPLGNAAEGLAGCWKRRIPQKISSIPACAECQAAPECGGGCRFRAGGPSLPDAVMCAAFGIK